MPLYLVEVYVPRSAADEARAAGHRARAAAEALARDGIAIRYVRTTFLPGRRDLFPRLRGALARRCDAGSNTG